MCSDSLGDISTEFSNTQYSDAVVVDVKTLLEDFEIRYETLLMLVSELVL